METRGRKRKREEMERFPFEQLKALTEEVKKMEARKKQIFDERQAIYDKIGMEVFCKDLHGKTLTIEDMRPSDTVNNLMQMIQTKTGVPSCQQRLIYAGRQLDEDRTLADYGISAESTIHLVLRMRGS